VTAVSRGTTVFMTVVVGTRLVSKPRQIRNVCEDIGERQFWLVLRLQKENSADESVALT